MLPNVPLSQLYTEARRLTSQLDGLAPRTTEYERVRQQLHLNQTTIHEVTQALRDVGNRSTH